MSDFAHWESKIDHAISQLAAGQHGAVTRAQLLGLGLGSASITRRVARGSLHRVHAGVYAVGRPLSGPLERAAAAVLACGERAVLSHASALALWALPGFGWPRQAAVTVACARRTRPGIQVHTCQTLLARDVRTHERIRVTSPARTLLDCAPQLSERYLRRAVNAALRRNVLRRSQLQDLIERSRGHPGAAPLAEFAESRPGQLTRSVLEDDFESFCLRHGLPRALTNVTVGGDEVDAYFAAERLIVELDSWDFHDNRLAFEADRERDARHLALGIVTLRLTWEGLHARPEHEAERLRKILRARRAAA